MKNKKKTKNKKNKFEIFMSIFVGAIVICLFTAGYAMTLYESVIAPIFVGDSNTVTDTNKNDEIILFDNNKEAKIPSDNTSETETETPLVNTEKPETKDPTISVGSINPEHKNDPDYVTYEINITDANYTEEVNGQKIKKKVPNMKGGTISLPKSSPLPKNGGSIYHKAIDPNTYWTD